MKCPNCGSDMESEIYRNLRKGSIGLQMIVYCPKGDFMSDSANPSRVESEVESAYEWNRVRKQNAMAHNV